MVQRQVEIARRALVCHVGSAKSFQTSLDETGNLGVGCLVNHKLDLWDASSRSKDEQTNAAQFIGHLLALRVGG